MSEHIKFFSRTMMISAATGAIALASDDSGIPIFIGIA